jgi:hypothetical protein
LAELFLSWQSNQRQKTTFLSGLIILSLIQPMGSIARQANSNDSHDNPGKIQHSG